MQSEIASSFLTPALFASHAGRGAWKCVPHLAMVDKLLVRAAAGGERIMINLPPQHGKSELVSRYFPPWYLSLFPDRRVILASYEADYAARWGAGARDLIDEYGGRVGVYVRSDSSAKHRWEIDGHSGGMIATGVGGALTGRGADVLIIDDPIKGDQEAQSDVYRERVWDWYRSVAYTRLQPNASVILIQTRWHEDDLTGRLLEQEPQGWTRLILPALAGEGDALGRMPGEALWPTRFDEDYLAQTRELQGEYWWNALYQQAPSPPGGACFHRSWFRHYTITSEGAYMPRPTMKEPEPKPVPMATCRRFTTVDTAASQRTSADYTVIATWDASPDGRLFLVDVVRERYESPDIPPRIREVFDTHRPMYLLVERAFIGIATVQAVQRMGLPVRELDARKLGDKWTRAQDAVAKMEAGRICWPSWMHDFEEELASFPHGAHDDLVDNLAYAAIHQSELGQGRSVAYPAKARIPTPRG